MHFPLFATFLALTAANLSVLQWCRTHLQSLPRQNTDKIVNLPAIVPPNEFIHLDSSTPALSISLLRATDAFEVVRSCFDSVEAKNALFLESLQLDLQPGSVKQWEFVSKTIYEKVIAVLREQKAQFLASEREKIAFEGKEYTVEKRHLGSFLGGSLHRDWSFKVHLQLARKGWRCTQEDEDEKLSEFVSFVAARLNYLDFGPSSNLVNGVQFPLAEDQAKDLALEKLERALSAADLQQKFRMQMEESILAKLIEIHFDSKEVSLQDWNQKILTQLNCFEEVPFYPQFNDLSLSPEFSVGELGREWHIEEDEIDLDRILRVLRPIIYAKEHLSTEHKSKSIVHAVITTFKRIERRNLQYLLDQEQQEYELAFELAKKKRQFRIKIFALLFAVFLMILCCLLLLIRKKTYKKQTSFY